MTRDEFAPAPRSSRWVRFALALVLVGVAIGVVVLHREELAKAWAHARGASPVLLVGIALLPLASLLTTGASLWVLTLRFGRVGAGEMLALVSSAWLLNHLPMRPGMIGRLAYHKRVNKIRVKHSVRVLIEATILTAFSAAGLLGAGVLLASTPPIVAWSIIAGACVALGGLGVGFGIRGRTGMLFALAGVLRVLDMLIWAGRYALVMSVLGHPLSLADAVIIASASQIAMTIPITGNGLGIREWAVALTGTALGVGSLDLVLAADLLNRAAELLVAVPCGLAGAAVVARSMRARRNGIQNERAGEPVSTPADTHAPGPELSDPGSAKPGSANVSSAKPGSTGPEPRIG